MLSIFHLAPKCRVALFKRFCHRRTMCTNGKKPFTILVEGNIGSGKTTFLKNFQNNKNILTLYEPIEEWKNLGSHNLMSLFYKDIPKWGFSFQSYILLTMMKSHQMETERPVKMMERSIYSGRYVFIENLSRMNMLKRAEFAVLDEWFRWLIETGTFSVDLIVYLKTDPEVAHERIQKRSREGEERITLDYIRKLHQCHEDWLFGKKGFICPAPVLCLNANNDVETVRHEYGCFESQIKL